MRRPVLSLLILVAASMPVLPAHAATVTHGDRRVCAQSSGHLAACQAHIRTLVGSDGRVTPDASVTYTFGYAPGTLQSVYGVTGLTSNTLVAVVDAYASPNAAADLAVYRAQFNLGAATLTQVDQRGGDISSVAGDVGWGQEEMLDLEMVSAMCRTCPLLYVGADSATFADLGAAVDRAVQVGAKVVSNSYGASEFNGVTTYASHYNHTGVAITVSSGDSGYGVQAPASFNTVTAVGGTTLTVDGTGHRSNETVWSGAGSGCSSYVGKPSWQHDTGCLRRTVADVAAVADPATGVAVYDSFGSTGDKNWYVFGGTSVAAPLIGGIYGLAGPSSGVPAALAYGAPVGSLFDVISGTNAHHCRAGYLCRATTGYDGPTGMGTPNGTGAF